MLLAGEYLSAISKATGIHRNRVRRIRDFHAHPFRPGPKGRPGYGLYRGPIPGTVVLRKIRETA
jgi:hypothetical protein